MRFRLSSVFLWFIILALCLAWARDHIASRRINLLGTWQYPTDDAGGLGYWSRLTFHRDGRFEKQQNWRKCSVSYSGTFVFEGDATIVFHVTGRSFRTSTRREPETKSLDALCVCHYAIDRSGCLLIKDVMHVPTNIGPLPKTHMKTLVGDDKSSETDWFVDMLNLNWEIHQRCN